MSTVFEGTPQNRGVNYSINVKFKLLQIIIFYILYEIKNLTVCYYLGNNQHKGTSSKPREFVIDDLISPQPPAEEFIRVQVKFITVILFWMYYYNNIINVLKYLFQTPPQKITMSRHYFPSVLDDFDQKVVPTEESEELNLNNVEPVVKAVQKDPKYYTCSTILLR